MNGDVRVINRILCEEWEGKWYPIQLPVQRVGGVVKKTTITNNIAGNGTTYENAVWTLLADGSAGTLAMNGGAPTALSITNLGAGQFRITIPTAKTLKLAHIDTLTLDGSLFPVISSYGKDDGIKADCIINLTKLYQTDSFPTGDLNNSINVQYKGEDEPNSAGWKGLITDIRTTEFDITLTQVGTGLEITCQQHMEEAP